MTTRTIHPMLFDGPEAVEVGPQQAACIALLEGDLDDDQARELREALDEDPEMARELEAYQAIASVTRGLPFEFAPDHFVADVTGRIRAGSQGRFFGESFLYTTRTPYEAIAVVMIAIMASAWMLMGTPHDAGIEDAAEAPRLEAPHSP